MTRCAPKHYVTLAELLVRLGSFGLGLTWRVEFDAEARVFAGDELVLVLTEFDGSLWDVRAVDERALNELRRHYPGTQDL